MTDQPRSATVTAIAAAELLRIDRKTLSTVLAEHGEVLARGAAVRARPARRPVDAHEPAVPAVRRASARAARVALQVPRDRPTARALLAAGDRPDGLYIVLAGKFIVQPQRRAVATLGPGELIGETALLSGGHVQERRHRARQEPRAVPARGRLPRDDHDPPARARVHRRAGRALAASCRSSSVDWISLELRPSAAEAGRSAIAAVFGSAPCRFAGRPRWRRARTTLPNGFQPNEVAISAPPSSR